MRIIPMEKLKIERVCQRCSGTGVETVVIDGVSTEISCVGCGGDGAMESPLYIDFTAMNAKLPNAFKLIFTYQIVEVIDATEYAALVDAAKDGLRIILSCGVVDLIHTGKIYLNLMAIFGSSPITKAAIEAL